MTRDLRHQLRSLTQRLPSRDLTSAVLRRHRRRRVRQAAMFTGAAALVLATGSLAVVALPSDGDRPGPATAPTGAPPRPAPSAAGGDRLEGTFFYHRVIDGEREQVWAWTIGQEPRRVADVGDAADLAQEYYAWQSMAVAPDGSRLAWVPRDGRVIVVDTANGREAGFDVGGADRGCLPPVWSSDGTRLLIHNQRNEFAWLDPETDRLSPVLADLSDACGAVAFTAADGTAAVAFEDFRAGTVRAVTEAGDPLWRIEVDQLDQRLDPGVGLWRLVDVARGGRYACIDLQPDVDAGGGGGGRWLAGNLVVDTTTGMVVADGRPATGLCSIVTADGYLTRIDDSTGRSAEQYDEYFQQLQLTGYTGEVLTTLDEPPEIYLSSLIGYAPLAR